MHIARVSAAMLLAAAVVVPASAEEDKVLNIYNWSDYIAEDTIANFEAETGIDVTYDVFDSNEVLEAKLIAGSSGYDIVVPSAGFLARQIQAGVFQPVDKSRLPNASNLDADIMARVSKYDPGNEHAIVYMWGTTGLGLNVAKVKERLGDDADLTSWNLIFDPDTVAKLADCGVAMLDAPTETIPAAMNYLGLDPTSTDTGDFEKAGELLKSVRPHIKYFHSSQYINDLANGEICLAMGWSGDVLQARDRADEADNDVEVGYVIPTEGALIWFDMMAIPKDAKHPRNAHLFLDYMMRPEVIAGASNYVYYANGNAASVPLLEEDLINDPGIYPSEETKQKLFPAVVYTARQDRAINRIWTAVTTGQ